MSATRKLKRSIAVAQGAKRGMPKGFALIPTSRKRTAKFNKLMADQAKIRAANDEAVKADPELATLTDEQLAARNLKEAEAQAPSAAALEPAQG